MTCWIQQSVSPKQVVGFKCVFNSEIDQLVRKFIVDFFFHFDVDGNNSLSVEELVDAGVSLGIEIR